MKCVRFCGGCYDPTAEPPNPPGLLLYLELPTQRKWIRFFFFFLLPLLLLSRRSNHSADKNKLTSVSRMFLWNLAEELTHSSQSPLVVEHSRRYWSLLRFNCPVTHSYIYFSEAHREQVVPDRVSSAWAWLRQAPLTAYHTPGWDGLVSELMECCEVNLLPYEFHQ